VSTLYIHSAILLGMEWVMASTDINGTYEFMYLVTQDEKFHGKTSHWDLVNDGSGGAAINPVASQVTISGAPGENGHSNHSQFSISVAGSDQFTFVSTAETTTFGQGFIVQDTASGQYYFVTNQAFAGADNPAAAHLSTEHAAPPPPACFMAGTGVATRSGEVAVELLQPGDLVLTEGGGYAPVAWIGRKTVARRFLDPLQVVPVRIKAHALSTNVPSRDLLISPDHAILLDGALCQAGALVNGLSIVRETDAPDVFTYYHVELDDHSLIFADGVLAETFIDHVERTAFDNWEDHPGGKSIVEMPYPRARAHRQVPRSVRDDLARRAAVVYGPTEAASVA
jgi:hypothetical protein